MDLLAAPDAAHPDERLDPRRAPLAERPDDEGDEDADDDGDGPDDREDDGEREPGEGPVVLGRIEEGHRAEVSLRAVEWIRAVASRLARGFVITIDYGDLAKRLYTVDRPRGTLMAYSEHTAGEDFYSAPGETDLTAHVNFSSLIDAGKEAGLELAGFTTQERFLLALGERNVFADICDPGQSEIEQLQARLKLKRLINPEGMGNIFKVLIQRRGVEPADLAGLKFQR